MDAENCERLEGNGNVLGITLSWTQHNPLNRYVELKSIKNLFKEAILHYFEDLHKLVIPAGTKFMISDSWFVNVRDPGIKTPAVVTNVHNHPFSVISGIFYLDDSDHGTMIYSDVKKPHWPFGWNQKGNIHTDLDTHPLKSEKGMLILFPAETRHATIITKDAKDRNALVFNVWPVGTLSERNTTRLDMVDALTEFMEEDS